MRDIDVRHALRKMVKDLHIADPETLFVEELEVCEGAARVDLAVVNGSLHGYEIKSELDTLGRLPFQCAMYSQALQYVTIVAAPSHLAKIESERLVPHWWGILRATNEGKGVRLSNVRDAKPNPSLDPLALAQFLWRQEALELLMKHGLAKGIRTKARHHLWLRLATSFSAEELGDFVCNRFKERGAAWRVPK